MRSYYAHLATTVTDKGGPIAAKPTFRSSAIFPVFHREGLSSRLLFLGYWFLKRNIPHLSAVLSLRSLEGRLLARTNFSVTEARAYRFELAEELERAGLPLDQPFEGSWEIEFYSAESLVFPYPAVDVNYYGPQFSTIVHTAQRVYNDYDDMQKNSQTSVPESGFNLYVDDNHEPFISLINGAEPVAAAEMKFQFFNSRGETLLHTASLGRLAPYQTTLFYPAASLALEAFFNGEVGFCKVQFDVNWIYPRLLVGNLCRKPDLLTITHTYYDCSQACSDSDYWAEPGPGWYTANLMLPLVCEGDYFTNIYFYPIYSSSTVNIDVEIYDFEGALKGKKKAALTVHSPGTKAEILRLRELLQELGIDAQRPLAVRLMATAAEGQRLPARIKLGFDIGKMKGPLPCNICTNLQPFNPRIEGKPRSFKWAPLLVDQWKSTLWIMNSSPHVDGGAIAMAELTFYREKDGETLHRTIQLPPQGFILIEPAIDSELDAFFEHTVGWCTIVTNNPYMTTYSFVESRLGAVGGDHGF